MTDISKIRNFSIVAHIDHGKSTLADRLLEYTKSVTSREMEDRILDNMDLERERGITIKARAIRFLYLASDGIEYVMNLIDTPGHVDFNYEVSRSLKACEGAVLIVDATQGVQAQTLANAYLAIGNDLAIVPVINKIDLASADIDNARREIEDIIGIPADDAPCISAKTGLNIADVLEKIVRDVPPPIGDSSKPLTALIFDSYYDTYKGVIVYFRVKDGSIGVGDTVKLMNNGGIFTLVEVGTLSPLALLPRDRLFAGEVGYFAASIKDISETEVGDTITTLENGAKQPLEGFKKCVPMVFAGIYPADGSKYGDLKDALEKLRLNDSALSFDNESSVALGFGFRCGFLGLLHMEVVEERLEREFDLDLI
ncbi:MAG: translation elongation factor 4, partial [Clostridia bacterium]